MGLFKITLILLLWALSFETLRHVPSYISINSTYNILLYLTVNFLFAFAFFRFMKSG